MPTNHTPNYQLSQWERSDKVLRTDFNADNAKVDAALAGQAAALAGKADASALAALQATVGGKADTSAVNALSTQLALRNCRVVTQSYTGDGATSKTFSFAGRPMLVYILGRTHSFFCLQGAPVGFGTSYTGGGQQINTSWAIRGITITSPNNDATCMCNYKGDSYNLLALIEP